MEVTLEDEYQHLPPSDNLLWREGYHFNGYDPARRTGISISIGIRPMLRFKEEIVTIHHGAPLLTMNKKRLDKNDVFKLGSLKMELLQPLKRWKIYIKDSFQEIKSGIPLHSSEVEFNLRFESSELPYRYSTEKEHRYEQPGFLRGEVQIGEKTVDFEGRGIRDHSWGFRSFSQWGEWYGLMGCLGTGKALTLAYTKIDGKIFCSGWLRTDNYHKIRTIRVKPVASGNSLEKCFIEVETLHEKLEIVSQLISSVPLSVKEGEAETVVIESLVQLDGGQGYGFMWHGGRKLG